MLTPAVKIPLGTLSAHSEWMVLESQSSVQFQLPLHMLGINRWWFKPLDPCPWHRRPRLALSCVIPGWCRDLGSKVDGSVLLVSLAAPLCFSSLLLSLPFKYVKIQKKVLKMCCTFKKTHKVSGHAVLPLCGPQVIGSQCFWAECRALLNTWE